MSTGASFEQPKNLEVLPQQPADSKANMVRRHLRVVDDVEDLDHARSTRLTAENVHKLSLEQLLGTVSFKGQDVVSEAYWDNEYRSKIRPDNVGTRRYQWSEVDESVRGRRSAIVECQVMLTVNESDISRNGLWRAVMVGNEINADLVAAGWSSEEDLRSTLADTLYGSFFDPDSFNLAVDADHVPMHEIGPGNE